MELLLKNRFPVTPENLFERIHENLVSSRIVYYPRWICICDFGLNFWGIYLEDKYLPHPEDQSINKLVWDIGELFNQRVENRTINRPGKIVGWIKVSKLRSETSFVEMAIPDNPGEEAIKIMSDLVSQVRRYFNNLSAMNNEVDSTAHENAEPQKHSFPPMPKTKSQGGKGNDWVAWYHAMKKAGYSRSFNDISQKSGFNADYLKHLNQIYLPKELKNTE